MKSISQGISYQADLGLFLRFFFWKPRNRTHLQIQCERTDAVLVAVANDYLVVVPVPSFGRLKIEQIRKTIWCSCCVEMSGCISQHDRMVPHVDDSFSSFKFWVLRKQTRCIPSHVLKSNLRLVGKLIASVSHYDFLIETKSLSELCIVHSFFIFLSVFVYLTIAQMKVLLSLTTKVCK